MKKVKIVAVKDDVIEDVLSFFVRDGSSRRPRLFSGRDGAWEGEIHYGENHQYSVPVSVMTVEQSAANLTQADWFLISVDKFSRHFSTSPKRVANVRLKLPKGKVMAIRGKDNHGFTPSTNTLRSAANHLGAEITGTSVFRPEFLAFPSGEESRHFQTVAGWVKDEKKVKIVSGCCLNANESRRGIVENLNPDIVNLLARTAGAAFDQMPISDWYIYTFGPKDFDWLGDLGIQKVLLPYMWDAPKAQVLKDMELNYALVMSLGQTIQAKVNFPVIVGQLSDYTAKVDLEWLVEASRERARKMLPGLMSEPPIIFTQLKSEQEVFDRVQQEAFLYLLDTVRWGQISGEDRIPVLCAGLEVHGGYWAHGNLFNGPNGEFLPLSWLPQAVRQHWGDWAAKNQHLAKERLRLDRMLNYFGY